MCDKCVHFCYPRLHALLHLHYIAIFVTFAPFLTLYGCTKAHNLKFLAEKCTILERSLIKRDVGRHSAIMPSATVRRGASLFTIHIVVIFVTFSHFPSHYEDSVCDVSSAYLSTGILGCYVTV
jgi:hypothetical protein